MLAGRVNGRRTSIVEQKLIDASKLAADIANVSADSNEVEEFYKLHGDFSSLDSAFVPSI